MPRIAGDNGGSVRPGISRSSRLVSSGVADLFEGAFDELLALLADVVIDGGHRLDRAGGGTGEGELAIGDFALIEGEGAVAEDDKAAVGEFAAFVFVEIEDHFFVGEFVLGDFHLVFQGLCLGFSGSWNSKNERARRFKTLAVICLIL